MCNPNILIITKDSILMDNAQIHFFSQQQQKNLVNLKGGGN